MVFLRKGLIWLRKWYKEDLKKLLFMVLAGVILAAAVSFAVDILLPFEGIYNVIRSLILIPTSAALFALMYVISLFFHYQQSADDKKWIPIRARFSPSWRRRLALIVGAILIVIMQAIDQKIGYTLSSSALGATVIGLFAFIRTSKEEQSREDLGIPDTRDVIYGIRKKEMEKEVEKNQLSKKNKKKSRKDRKRSSFNKQKQDTGQNKKEKETA